MHVATRCRITHADAQRFAANAGVVLLLALLPQVGVSASEASGVAPGDQPPEPGDLFSVTAELRPMPPKQGDLRLAVVFGEPMHDFDAATMLVVDQGAVVDQNGGGVHYNITIRPTVPGPVQISLPADVVLNAAGNGNAAAVPLTLAADLTPPSVELRSGAAAVITGPFTVSVLFSEPVIAFDARADLQLSNAEVVTATGAEADYVVSLRPLDEGPLTVALPAGAVADVGGGLPNTASNTIALTADLTPPVVTLVSREGAATNTGFSVAVQFSEAVEGFDPQQDVIVIEGRADIGGAVVRDGQLTFGVRPLEEGPTTLAVVANAVTDAAGKGNAESERLTVIRDTRLTAPEVHLHFHGRTDGQVVAVEWRDERVVPDADGRFIIDVAVPVGGNVVPLRLVAADGRVVERRLYLQRITSADG